MKIIMLTCTLLLAGCAGGGETVVAGLGNSGNFFGGEQEEERLATLLARTDAVPEVKDQDLIEIYEVLKVKALEGDVSSAIKTNVRPHAGR